MRTASWEAISADKLGACTIAFRIQIKKSSSTVAWSKKGGEESV
jgi:hypothetical protein